MLANKIVIINYRMGNVASVQKGFKKIGAETILSHEKNDIENADYLVLPGVGAFGDGMKNLKELGLIEILNNRVLHEKTPFLGICLGMQLLATTGYEFAETPGLGWIKGKVIKLSVPEKFRLPHVGWDDIEIKRDTLLLQNIPGQNFYFVHSYHLAPYDASVVTSICTYGQDLAATIEKGNIYATQFHPEKSQTSGLMVLKNFLMSKRHA